MDVDTVIIGAGPAGSAAAISCIQAGLSVVIVAGKNNRHNPTDHTIQPSESIHPGVLSLLEQLQAEDVVTLAAEGVYDGVQTGEIFSALGSQDNGEPWPGYHINRQRFDAALLNAAVAQGAGTMHDERVSDFIIHDDCVVGIRTKAGKEITCKYTIDASGYKRFGGKKLQFKELFYSLPLTACSGVTENIDPHHRLFENRFTQFIPNPGGWTWLAPEPPNKCTWTKLSAKGQQALTVPGELEAFTNNGNIQAANCRWRIFRPVCKEGIILCGDAAAILDPAAGQGILNALLSGIKAAQTLMSCIAEPDQEAFHLAAYDDWFFQYYHDKAKKLQQHYADLEIDVFDGF